jgi:hypothetical protein
MKKIKKKTISSLITKIGAFFLSILLFYGAYYFGIYAYQIDKVEVLKKSSSTHNYILDPQLKLIVAVANTYILGMFGIIIFLLGWNSEGTIFSRERRTFLKYFITVGAIFTAIVAFVIAYIANQSGY